MNKGIGFGMIVVLVIGILIGWFAKGLLGSGGPPPGMPGMGAMPPPVVAAMTVKETSLEPINEYIAAVEPIQDVMIRSEVSGYIDDVHFTEGSLVQEGDLLFTIDPSSYQAKADAAEADLIRTQKLYERMQKADTRSVSKADMENAKSDYLRAQADYKLAQVALNYTQIKAPVSGRIGAAKLTKGNYVTSASEPLAHLVQLDPIRVVFSQTDREYLAYRRSELAGHADILEAHIRLPDGSDFPTLGKKDFDDNAINPQTGTIAVRYLFDNPNGLLIPGGYVTAQLENPAGQTGLKIPQRAILMDQQGMYVLTVDVAGVVGIARVTVGEQIAENVVILSGLKTGDRIVIDGLQKARPGATVQVVEDHL